MFRELFQIVMAIQLSTHNLPPTRVEMLAETIQQRAIYADVDPLIVVAIITHESQWNERNISVDGKDIGLMQIRVANMGNNTSYLLLGQNNIRAGTDLIKRDIDYCRKVLGREPTTQEWLSPYQGPGRNGQGYKCQPTKLTKLFADYASCLEDAVINGETKNCREIYWPELKTLENK